MTGYSMPTIRDAQLVAQLIDGCCALAFGMLAGLPFEVRMLLVIICATSESMIGKTAKLTSCFCFAVFSLLS